VLALLTATVAVPAIGAVGGEPAIAPADGGRLVPTRFEAPAGELETDPSRCRLLPADQQPDRLPAAPRDPAADGMVVTLYVPATTCNTPS
jgi:hypothetical protein